MCTSTLTHITWINNRQIKRGDKRSFLGWLLNAFCIFRNGNVIIVLKMLLRCRPHFCLNFSLRSLFFGHFVPLDGLFSVFFRLLTLRGIHICLRVIRMTIFEDFNQPQVTLAMKGNLGCVIMTCFDFSSADPFSRLFSFSSSSLLSFLCSLYHHQSLCSSSFLFSSSSFSVFLLSTQRRRKIF